MSKKIKMVFVQLYTLKKKEGKFLKETDEKASKNPTSLNAEFVKNYNEGWKTRGLMYKEVTKPTKKKA